MYQIMVQFGDVVPFLTNPDLGSPATCSHLVEIVEYSAIPLVESRANRCG